MAATKYERTSIIAICASLVVVIGLPLTLLHCSSEEDPGSKSSSSSSNPQTGGSVAQARDYFLKNAYPIFDQNCAKCHASGERGAPEWLAKNGDGSYNAIEATPGYLAAPTVSPIMQKGLHSGPPLTQSQQDIVQKWLAMEVNARKLSGDTDRPANLRAGFKAFGACMSYTRWTQLGLDKICLTPTLGDTGACIACHASGQSSLWLSQNGPETFTKFTTFPYVQKLVTGRVNASGAFDGLEGSRRLINKGAEQTQYQANSHPRFQLTAEQTTNLVTFVEETINNMNAKRCDGADKPPDAGPPPQQQN
jgi:hypothetical protein